MPAARILIATASVLDRGFTLRAHLASHSPIGDEHALANAFLGRPAGDLHLPVGRCAPNREEALARREHDELSDEECSAGEAENGEYEKDGHGSRITP